MLNMYTLEVTFVLCVSLLSRALADFRCDATDLLKPSSCPQNHLCDTRTNTCQCKPGYERVNDTFCTKYETTESSTLNSLSLVASQSDHHVVVGIVVPLVVLLLVIIGVYVGKKYKLVTWVRTKINQRNTNYDEFMIGQDDDDPPLH